MLYIYAFLVLIGFLPMAVVLYKKYKTDKLRKHGIHTMGTIRELYGVGINMINMVLIEYPVKETGEIISKNIRIAGIPWGPDPSYL